jgi:hypothetical protein
MLCIARHHSLAAPAPIPHDRPYADAKSREQWDIPIASWSHLLAKVPDPWPAVRDPGALKRGSSGLGNLSGVRIRGPGPWAVVHGAGAIVSMAGGVLSRCLAMKKAAMNAAIILKLGVS